LSKFALGYNKSSIGICLIGIDEFYAEQFQTALFLCGLFKKVVPDVKILGHNEVTDRKSCPNFKMSFFRELLNRGNFTLDEIRIIMQGSVING